MVKAIEGASARSELAEAENYKIPAGGRKNPEDRNPRKLGEFISREKSACVAVKRVEDRYNNPNASRASRKHLDEEKYRDGIFDGIF